MRVILMLVMAMTALLAGCTAPERQVAAAPTPAETFLAAGELPAEFRIERIVPYPAANPAEGLTVAPLGLEVMASMPALLGESGKFTLQVNGQAVPAMEVGGGFDDGRSSRTFRIYPGAPGAKSIAVLYEVNGEQFIARQDYAFASAGDMLLLDHYDGELLLAPPVFSLLAYFVTEPQVTCNGVAVVPDEAGGVPPLAGAPARLLACRPALQPGRNELLLTWRDQAGAAQEKKYVFIYAPNSTVKVGDEVPLGFGYAGSRSGPFFQLAISDSTVAEVRGDQSTARFPRVADGQLSFGSALQQGVRALAPGRTDIFIMKSRYFLFPYAVADTVTITVAP